MSQISDGARDVFDHLDLIHPNWGWKLLLTYIPPQSGVMNGLDLWIKMETLSPSCHTVASE